MRSLWRQTAVFLILIILMLGCRAQQSSATPAVQLPNTATPQPSPTATATQTPPLTNTASPTATPMPTQTPSPTPSPTPTALPATVEDNLRAAQVKPVFGNEIAPCGYVDIFDFPIDPPDATHVSRGGGDFNIFRSRFGKFHAGEDWGGIDGTPNFGTPVYSIGHGLVTYAEPEGWNRDKGVVIIQHTYGNNRQILSFYGHLDPPSVMLEAGDCVERGDYVGDIGDPRSSPHLHFEIRTQAPLAPLSGYWPTDPREAGWIWPSQTIWESRVRAVPGVEWVRPFTAPFSFPIGQLDETTFALVEDGRLLTVEVNNGRSQPHLEDVDNIIAGLLHQEQIYLLIRGGQLLAFSLSLEPLWENELSGSGRVLLLPLSSGGVAVAVNEELQAFGQAGGFLWRADVAKRPFAFELTDERLLFSTMGDGAGLWQIEGAQRPELLVVQDGRPVRVEDTIWLHAPDGLYQLQGEELRLAYPLPEAGVQRGDLLRLEDGRLLLVHVDGRASRLLLFSSEGALLWQRRLERALHGDHELLQIGERPHLLTSRTNGELLLHTVALEEATLTLRFRGGTRTPLLRDSWRWQMKNGRLLLNIGGGPMALFEPEAPD